MKYTYKKFAKSSSIFTLLMVISLTGCQSTLRVHGDFPTPVINRMPLSVGLVYLPDFINYQYTEIGKDRDEWVISLGDAQVKLFNVVVDAMFNDVVQTPTSNFETATSVDLFLQPSLDSFQYNTPNETKGKMFEVWLKYNVKIFDNHNRIAYV